MDGTVAAIFISYRRDDTGPYAGRLRDWLSRHFGAEQVFRDLNTIPPGERFPLAIKRAVGSCEVLLAVIGTTWLTVADGAGRRRLDDPEDFVRVEIETALGRSDVLVIPVLVGAATRMPAAADLPGSLAALAECNAVRITDEGWDDQVGRLIRTIEELVEPLGGPKVGRPLMKVTAEVIGAAREFTRDEQLLQWFVDQFEKDVREKSDKAWEKVRAEEEKKARAEAEKARKQAEKEARVAEERRRQAIAEARAENRPLSIQELAAQFAPKFDGITTGMNLADMIKFDGITPAINIDPNLLPKYNLGSYMTVGSQFGPPGQDEPEPPPEPLTDEQINEEVLAYRAELEARWESCKEYLAGVAWPGLKFRITNAEGFFTNVQLVLTFHGAKGLDYEPIENFVWEKLENPGWTKPFDLYDLGVTPPMRPSFGSQNPVKWEHDDNRDLVVKITLAELRPYDVWPSDDDDVVLMLQGESLGSVDVTYTVTAYEHHDRLEGDPFTVPVEEVDMFESVRAALDALKKSN